MQMPSGNKIIGSIYGWHINIDIYISSKTVTQGLCGSFDGNRYNDIFNRFTRVPATFNKYGVIDTAASWRLERVAFAIEINCNKTVSKLIQNAVDIINLTFFINVINCCKSKNCSLYTT